MIRIVILGNNYLPLDLLVCRDNTLVLSRRCLTKQLLDGERDLEFAGTCFHFRHNSINGVAFFIIGRRDTLSKKDRYEYKENLHG